MYCCSASCSFSYSCTRHLTMSPIEISPTTRSPSSTGRWRNLPLVIISMMAETVSLCRQLTTLRVITSLTGASSTLAPRSPSTRTISRSDRMPSTPLLLITSTAPILRSPRILTAVESLASGSTLRMWWPLVSRIARTVIGVSLKSVAPLSWRVLVSFRSSINSLARMSLEGAQLSAQTSRPLAGLNPRRDPGFSLLQLTLTAPWKEVGREIRRIAVTFLWRARSFSYGIRVRFHRPPIQMPGGMTEHRKNDGETDKERQRTDQQQRRNNQPPCGDGQWIFHRNPQRRPDCVNRGRMPVEHQWKRHNADTQGHDREQEADATANDDERPSCRCRQYARR